MSLFGNPWYMLKPWKGKGILFIVLYPPKCSHDLPSLAGTVHTETIRFQSPEGYSRAAGIIKRSSSKHCLMPHILGTHFSARWTEAIWNKLSCLRTDQSAPAGIWNSNLLITSPTPHQLSYFVPLKKIEKALFNLSSLNIQGNRVRSIYINGTGACVWTAKCGWKMEILF